MPKLDMLKGKLLEKHKKYADCAGELNISITSFSDKMNGKSKFNIEEANSLAKYIGLTNKEKIDIFLN